MALIVLVASVVAAAVAVRPTGRLAAPRAPRAPVTLPTAGPDPLFAPPVQPSAQPPSLAPSYPDPFSSLDPLDTSTPPPDGANPAPPKQGSSGGGSSSGNGFDRGRPPLPVTAPGAGSFVAVTGGGCPAATNASYFAAYPAGSPVANLSGGWVNGKCTDRFWSVPMSGSADRDDPGTYVLWWFTTAPVTSGDCEIWVYVPKTARAADVAGDPTRYDVLRSNEDRSVIGTFSVRQVANRGSWVKGGTFGFDGGRIAVRLNNRGDGGGGARHGAAEVLTRCTPR
jgi:hypothetical protein